MFVGEGNQTAVCSSYDRRSLLTCARKRLSLALGRSGPASGLARSDGRSVGRSVDGWNGWQPSSSSKVTRSEKESSTVVEQRRRSEGFGLRRSGVPSTEVHRAERERERTCDGEMGRGRAGR